MINMESSSYACHFIIHKNNGFTYFWISYSFIDFFTQNSNSIFSKLFI